MLGFGAVGRFALGQLPTAQSQVLFSWFAPLSEPVRQKRGLLAAEQQFSALAPNPVVSFSWFDALSEPQRQRPRSAASLYPAFFFQPAPSPFVATGWFSALSEPVRYRAGLRPAAQQFTAYISNPTTVTPFAWFAALSEPVRFLKGLAPRLQQFFTGPNQLRPTPTATGVLAAIETKDVFLGGVEEFNRVVSGEVGIIEASFTGAQIGVSKVPAITSARISISIL